MYVKHVQHTVRNVKLARDGRGERNRASLRPRGHLDPLDPAQRMPTKGRDPPKLTQRHNHYRVAYLTLTTSPKPPQHLNHNCQTPRDPIVLVYRWLFLLVHKVNRSKHPNRFQLLPTFNILTSRKFFYTLNFGSILSDQSFALLNLFSSDIRLLSLISLLLRDQKTFQDVLIQLQRRNIQDSSNHGIQM